MSRKTFPRKNHNLIHSIFVPWIKYNLFFTSFQSELEILAFYLYFEAHCVLEQDRHFKRWTSIDLRISIE